MPLLCLCKLQSIVGWLLAAILTPCECVIEKCVEFGGEFSMATIQSATVQLLIKFKYIPTRIQFEVAKTVHDQ